MKLSIIDKGAFFNESLKTIKRCRHLIEKKQYDQSNQLIEYLDKPDIMKVDIREELTSLVPAQS